MKQLKNRYNDNNTNKRFVVGIDRAKMRLYDCEQMAQDDILDSGQDEEYNYEETTKEKFSAEVLMDSLVYELFPTPVLKVKYPKHKELQRFILDNVDHWNESHSVTNDFSNSVVHSFNKSNQSIWMLLDPEIVEFKEFVRDACADFLYNIKGYEEGEVSLLQAWVNTYYKSGGLPFHTHGNSVVSGTYYALYDSKKHEPIKFASPADVADMKPYLNPATDKLTKYNTTIASVPYEEGDVLLWDSYLRHGVSNDAV